VGVLRLVSVRAGRGKKDDSRRSGVHGERREVQNAVGWAQTRHRHLLSVLGSSVPR